MKRINPELIISTAVFFAQEYANKRMSAASLNQKIRNMEDETGWDISVDFDTCDLGAPTDEPVLPWTAGEKHEFRVLIWVEGHGIEKFESVSL